MAVTKYVITNNLSVLYNTREEAEAAFEAEVAKLESAFARSAFKFVYTKQLQIHIKVDSFTCNNIFVRFITAYPPVTGVAS